MKPCKCCGGVFSLDNFYTDNGLPDKKRNICKKCAKAKAKEWKSNNAERVKANNIYYELFVRNKEHRKEITKAYRKRPQVKLKKKLYDRRRKTQINNASFYISLKDSRKLYQQTCWNCGCKENITIDHVIPLSRGGTHGIGNIMALCRTCNLSKYNSTIMEWKISGRAKLIARSNRKWQK